MCLPGQVTVRPTTPRKRGGLTVLVTEAGRDERQRQRERKRDRKKNIDTHPYTQTQAAT